MDTTTADPNNHSHPNNQADQQPDSLKHQPPEDLKHPALPVSQAIQQEVPNSLSDRHRLLDTLQVKEGHKDRQVPDLKADILRAGPQAQRNSPVDIHRKDRKHRLVDRKDQLQDTRDIRRVDRKPQVQLPEDQHLVVINNQDRNDQRFLLHSVHQFLAVFTRLQVERKPRHASLLCKQNKICFSFRSTIRTTRGTTISSFGRISFPNTTKWRLPRSRSAWSRACSLSPIYRLSRTKTTFRTFWWGLSREWSTSWR